MPVRKERCLTPDAVCIDFVNTRWYVEHEGTADYLRDLERFNRLLTHWGLPPRAELDAAESDELVALRVVLGSVFDALAEGKPPAAEALAKLNGYLSEAVVRYSLAPTETGCQILMEPAGATETLASTIVRSFAEFIAGHDTKRLRSCSNPACRWIFYDESRNATRRWCGPTCSSLIKVRRFRERHRETAE